MTRRLSTLIFLTNLPAPVVLLMQVCPEAQERPFAVDASRSDGGQRVGNAKESQAQVNGIHTLIKMIWHGTCQQDDEQEVTTKKEK